MRQKRNAIIGLIVGLIVVGIGIYIIATYNIGYAKTTAVINDITYNYSGSSKDYYVYVSYTVDGILIKDVNAGWYDASMRVGKEIEILYKIAEPNVCKQAFPMIGCVISGVGGIFMIIGGCTFAGIKQAKAFEEKRLANPEYDNIKKENFFDDYFLNKDEAFNQYRFKIGKDYKMVDSNLFEAAIMKHKSGGLFKPTVYELINNKANKKVEITANNVVTFVQSFSQADPHKQGQFMIDGINCWEYINKIGFDIRIDLNGGLSYKVVDNDNKVVGIIRLNDFTNFISDGMFTINTNEYYASIVLLSAFIVYRTMNSSQTSTSWHVTR